MKISWISRLAHGGSTMMYYGSYFVGLLWLPNLVLTHFLSPFCSTWASYCWSHWEGVGASRCVAEENQHEQPGALQLCLKIFQSCDYICERVTKLIIGLFSLAYVWITPQNNSVSPRKSVSWHFFHSVTKMICKHQTM